LGKVRERNRVRNQRQSALKKALKTEELMACPLKLDRDAFERFMLKFAVHAHKGNLDAPTRVRGQRVTLSVEDSALRLKEAVLEAFPLYYVSMFNKGAMAQLASGAKGTYTFKADVPQEVLFKTMEKIGIIKTLDGDELV
jgi:hypothetical protein